MAKQRRRPPGSANTTSQVAENIGAALGTVMAKADDWLVQRQEIARELRDIADRLMAGENPFGQPVTTPSMLAEQVVKREGPAGLKRRRTVSEASAKVGKAQRVRFAKQTGESGASGKGARKSKKAKKRSRTGGG